MSSRAMASSMFAGVITLSLQTSALAYTGNEFLEVCEQDSARQHCISYVAGLTHAMNSSVFRDAGYVYCIPPEARASQHFDLITKFLEDNPTTRHLGLLTVALYAFSKGWPCND